MMSSLPYSFEIVVIDDGSTDGSLEEIGDLPVRVLRHRRNLGGGVARLTGLRHARGRWILQTDADGTYPVDRVPAMLERMKNGADMVIGARRRESATDWHWLRVFMKWALRSLAGRLAGEDIPDLNSGMRVYDRAAALAVCVSLSDRSLDHEHDDVGIDDERDASRVRADRLQRAIGPFDLSSVA